MEEGPLALIVQLERSCDRSRGGSAKPRKRSLRLPGSFAGVYGRTW